MNKASGGDGISAERNTRLDEAEVDVFLESVCFSYDLADVGNLISVSLHFLNLA